jgi:transcriptional regulator with XRE-family HTH domain
LIWTRKALIARLKAGPVARQRFVESQISNSIATQIRSLRNKSEWSQPVLAEKLDTSQNQIYRLENPRLSRPKMKTLKDVAAAFDVGLIVRFVPFGEMIDYLSGTPRTESGISTAKKRPRNFAEELPSLESSLIPQQPNALHKKNAGDDKVVSIETAMRGPDNILSEQMRPPMRASQGTNDGAAMAASVGKP